MQKQDEGSAGVRWKSDRILIYYSGESDFKGDLLWFIIVMWN